MLCQKMGASLIERQRPEKLRLIGSSILFFVPIDYIKKTGSPGCPELPVNEFRKAGCLLSDLNLASFCAIAP